MNSNRPYLIRAMHEWISDNNEVPHVIVDVSHKQTLVPAGFSEGEQIVLNLSFDATHNLVLGNELIRFSARFNGKSKDITFSPHAVLGIFSRDSGKGMMFEPEEIKRQDTAEKPEPKLKLVPKPDNKP